MSGTSETGPFNRFGDPLDTRVWGTEPRGDDSVVVTYGEGSGVVPEVQDSSDGWPISASMGKAADNLIRLSDY